MKYILSFPGALFCSFIVSCTLGKFVFPVDGILLGMSVPLCLGAIAKLSLAYQLLLDNVVAKKSDVFRIPLGFVIYLFIMMCVAGALVYIAFYGMETEGELFPQTVINLKFFVSSMGFALVIGILRWIEVKKDVRIQWEQRYSKHIGTMHLPQN